MIWSIKQGFLDIPAATKARVGLANHGGGEDGVSLSLFHPVGHMEGLTLWGACQYTPAGSGTSVNQRTDLLERFEGNGAAPFLS